MINNLWKIAVKSFKIIEEKIFLGGSFYNTSPTDGLARYIARLNGDGASDSNFEVGSSFNNSLSAVIIQDDGKIIAGGQFTSYNGTNINRIARLNTDGSLDTGFDIGTGFNTTVLSLAIQDDGKVVVGGNFAIFNEQSTVRIARLNTDGSLDTEFITGTGFNSAVSKFAIQDDGKVVAAGAFLAYKPTVNERVIQLNSDGSIDSSFDKGTGFSGVVNCAAIQDDGKILVGGTFTSYNGTSINRIARLNTDGSLDTSFNIGTGFNTTVNSFAIQDDGKILVGGSFTSYNGTGRNYIARLNTDGSLDTGFSVGTGFNTLVYSFAIQDDGKILVGGAFASYNGTSAGKIVRLNTDGSLDAGFNTGTGFNFTVRVFAIQDDGKILVGGHFTSYDGTNINRIARLNTDGSLDTGFNTGTGFSSNVICLAIQDDGKIIAGGQFTSYNNVSSGYIARLNTDGSLDTGFNTGTGFNNYLLYLAIQNDGKILVGGAFTSYNGIFRTRIARLNIDASIDADFDIFIDNNVNAIILI
jgi:uncharacterized delta-60 repeat protein